MDITAKFDLGITSYFIPKVCAFHEAQCAVLAVETVETVYSAVLPLCLMVFSTKYSHGSQASSILKKERHTPTAVARKSSHKVVVHPAGDIIDETFSSN